MELPIVLGHKPTRYIRIDRLPPLKGKFAIHFHLNETIENAHIKLEYGDTDYCLSLYIFKIKDFYENKEVKVRSYDLWPKYIMFGASIGKYNTETGTIEIVEKRNGYREDAVIVDWGVYEYNSPKIIFNFETRNLVLKYKIIFLREVKYYSPKYGWSRRSEYIFSPIE